MKVAAVLFRISSLQHIFSSLSEACLALTVAVNTSSSCFISPIIRDRLLDSVFRTLIDVHHGNYNPSRKVKSNMQEDSDGPMIRARAKQLQGALTSQIGMIEAASELKISNRLKLVQGCLFAYNWNLEMGKALNGSFDAELLEFGLIMQISEGINVVYSQNSK